MLYSDELCKKYEVPLKAAAVALTTLMLVMIVDAIIYWGYITDKTLTSPMNVNKVLLLNNLKNINILFSSAVGYLMGYLLDFGYNVFYPPCCINVPKSLILLLAAICYSWAQIVFWIALQINEA